MTDPLEVLMRVLGSLTVLAFFGPFALGYVLYAGPLPTMDDTWVRKALLRLVACLALAVPWWLAIWEYWRST